jgi:hypothetical protein
MLSEAMEEADNLGKVADYLEGIIPKLEIDDFNLIAQARSVREGHIAGLIDGLAVAADIRRYLTEAKAEVERVQNKWGAATISASKVAAQNIRAKALIAIDDPKAEYAKMKLTRLKAVHTWYHGGGKDNRTRKIQRAMRRASA